MSPPDLSVDVITVIAEHLAGLYAFGTLASLHLANHAVRQETLPVLYETVLMDDVEKLPYYKDGTQVNPVGFRYTKFRICGSTQICDAETARETASQFPNLLATIILDSGDARAVVHVHQPVSCATLFGAILPTPVQQQREPTEEHTADAMGCDVNAATANGDNSGCATMDKPLLHTIPAIRRVVLDDNAYITRDNTIDLKWTSQVQLGSAWLSPSMSGKKIQPALDTLFELLKLIGRHPDIESFREAEGQKIKELQGSPAAQTWPKYRQHNLGLEMSPEGFEAFIERFAQEAVLHPEIFLNRLEIIVKAEIHFNVMSGMVDQLVAIYRTHATSYRMLLPGVGPPYKLCTLFLDDYPTGQQRTFEDSMIPMEQMSVELEGPEEDMKYTNSDIAYTAAIQAKIGRAAAMAGAMSEDGQCCLM